MAARPPPPSAMGGGDRDAKRARHHGGAGAQPPLPPRGGDGAYPMGGGGGRDGPGPECVLDVHVLKSLCGKILGYGGNMIREMEACTGARVSISPVGMRDAAEGCRVVTLSGTPVQVAQCRWEVIRAVGETGVVQERSRGAAAPADLASRGGGGGGGGRGGGAPRGPPGGGSGMREQYTVEYPVRDPAVIGRIIGRGGETIRKLQVESGARMEVDRATDRVTIKGNDETINHARRLLDDLLGTSREYGGRGGERGATGLGGQMGGGPMGGGPMGGGPMGGPMGGGPMRGGPMRGGPLGGGPMGGGPMGGGPMSGGPMSGGPMSGGPVSGDQAMGVVLPGGNPSFVTLHAPGQLGRVIGRRGEMARRIEEETGTTIEIRKDVGNVEIRGAPSGVSRALQRVQDIVRDGYARGPPTTDKGRPIKGDHGGGDGIGKRKRHDDLGGGAMALSAGVGGVGAQNTEQGLPGLGALQMGRRGTAAAGMGGGAAMGMGMGTGTGMGMGMGAGMGMGTGMSMGNAGGGGEQQLELEGWSPPRQPVALQQPQQQVGLPGLQQVQQQPPMGQMLQQQPSQQQQPLPQQQQFSAAMGQMPPQGGAGSAGAWKEMRTDSGELYYWNVTTNTTSWDRPPGL